MYYDIDHGGSTPDTIIFEESSLRKDLEAGKARGGLIYADLAWKESTYVATKFPVKNTNTPEKKAFNQKFCGQRAIVENIFGELKNKFKILNNHFADFRFLLMKLKFEKVGSMTSKETRFIGQQKMFR